MVSYSFTHMIHNVVNPIINNPQNLVIIGCLLGVFYWVYPVLWEDYDTLYHGWFMGMVIDQMPLWNMFPFSLSKNHVTHCGMTI